MSEEFLTKPDVGCKGRRKREAPPHEHISVHYISCPALMVETCHMEAHAQLHVTQFAVMFEFGLNIEVM